MNLRWTKFDGIEGSTNRRIKYALHGFHTIGFQISVHPSYTEYCIPSHEVVKQNHYIADCQFCSRAFTVLTSKSIRLLKTILLQRSSCYKSIEIYRKYSRCSGFSNGKYKGFLAYLTNNFHHKKWIKIHYMQKGSCKQYFP